VDWELDLEVLAVTKHECPMPAACDGLRWLNDLPLSWSVYLRHELTPMLRFGRTRDYVAFSIFRY
jgi:hypothetical protein